MASYAIRTLTVGSDTFTFIPDLALASDTPTENSAVEMGTEIADRIYPVCFDHDGNLAVMVPWAGSTYGPATQIANGLMTAADKIKLDGLTQITNNEIDTIFSDL